MGFYSFLSILIFALLAACSQSPRVNTMTSTFEAVTSDDGLDEINYDDVKSKDPDVIVEEPGEEPVDNTMTLSIKNTKACSYYEDDSDFGENAIYEDGFTNGQGLLWKLSSRATGQTLDCGAFVQDLNDRFSEIEKSDFILQIAKIAGFDPRDYNLDILLDNNGDGLCNSIDSVVGSSSQLGSIFDPGFSFFSTDTPDNSFVITTQLMLFHNAWDAPDCDTYNENPDAVCACDKMEEPLILDFGGDGLQLTAGNEGVEFDIDNRGRMVPVAWTTLNTNDAFVVRDRNGNGQIDSGAELFGTATRNPNGTLAANGFEALYALDTNGDKVFDGADDEYYDLLLWFDRNQNGRSEPHELQKLWHRVKSINLAYKVIDKGDEHGNKIYAESYALSWWSSKKIYAADVWLQLGQ